jgi:hypothetical protein
MNKTLLTVIAAAVLAGVSSAPVQASSTVFESRDILTPTEALGRFDWLQKCYQGLLLEVHDQMFDPTVIKNDADKLVDLKNVLLYDGNGALRADAKYLTFGNEDKANPQSWFAKNSATAACVSIPSDYGVSAVMVSPTNVPTYCTAQSRNKDYEFIKEVTISGMTNTSDDAFYSNFVGQAAKVYKGNNYDVSMTPGFTDGSAYPEFWHIYVDWNRDGDFADANETHLVGSSSTTMTKTLTVPAGAAKGLTKMRVSMDYFGGSNNACSEIDSGEIEDYLLYIK